MNNISTDIYEFKVKIQDERYYNDDTNWGIYTFITKEDIPEYKEFIDPFNEKSDVFKMSTLCGKMQRLYIGSEYFVKAKLEYNKKYKTYQYNPINVTAIIPKTPEAQRLFLESIITKRQADILLEAYPNIVEDTINGKMENIDLSKTKGIKEYTWNHIKEKIINNYVISDIITLLQPLGVTYTMIKKLLNEYSNPTLLKQDLLNNPYILTKLKGLGFKRVDGLALKVNPELKISTKRTYAFIKYYLAELGESKGHTWVTLETLENAIRDNIPECEELYQQILDIERKTQTLLYIDDERNRVGLKYYRDIEISIFLMLKELDNYKVKWDLDVERGIKETEEELGFEFTDEQKNIITNVINHNILVISGKAGTGKTTITKALLKIYQNANKTIGACALSAKAAQRIIEATGFQAVTIHRLLGAKGLNEFEFNAKNPLPYDVVLLDEASMNNAKIFYHLISAIKLGSKVIVSGDCKQLPPIGFGNVFSDLLELKDHFHTYELTKVHRQAEKSGILTDANMIREGINPISQPKLKIVRGELQDMYYMFRDNREALNDIAIKTFIKSIETDGLDNVVIITPRKKDCINSTKEINKKIQDMLIDDSVPYLVYGSTKYKLGAKVIQRQNNYDKNIFNGEIGYIVDIYKDKPSDNDYNMFVVEYPNKRIHYTKNELEQLDLAYALTIHSSQGSGYKTVIVIIDNTHYALLDACLLYTAITRAKERCLLLAEPIAFKRCITQNKSIERQTWLKDITQKDIESFSNDKLHVKTNEFDFLDDEE